MFSAALPFPDGTWSYAAGTPRYNWTAAAIDGARANGIPWVVAGTHEPCISLGPSCSIGGDLLRLLVSKNVDLVLHGHEHLYARTHQLGYRTNCTTIQGAYDADCVVDSDGQMVAGAGTVLATVGTGGRSLTSIGSGDAELPYFAALAHAGRTPAYGFLDVVATADDLVARFVPTNGSTLTDAFTIHRGDPPPNVPPTAAFTSTTNNATASVDGRGSSDPEGPIASYSWDFGDGTTPLGSGAQTSHTYAAAGAYDVTLTVTDSANATNSITAPVTVSDPPPPGVDFVVDTFARTVSSGWGTADTGGPWSTAGTAANFAVNNGSGAITLPSAGQTRSTWLGATTRTDTDLRLTLSLDKRPNGNGAYLDVVGRRVSTNNEYRARMVMASTGRITVQLSALRGTATPVAIATAVTLPTTVTYAAGSQLNVRLQVTGTNPTTVRLKVWPTTQAEPTAWTTTATDTFAALQNPGAVGMTGYIPSGVTNTPVVVRVSSLTARPT
jgi:PKD repeat protein